MLRNTSLKLLAALMISVLIVAPASATNSDIGKERRWAEQIMDGLLDGDEVWLIDDIGHEFLGILTEGNASSGRAVILIHGIGVHPNWPDVIYPLRAGLLEHGTTTLSIQMPVLANEADPREYGLLFAEVPGRIEAALDYLEDEGYRDIVIVAHSMGASMTSFYLAQSSKANAISSVVLIGMGPGINGTENIDSLSKIKLPVLDLYGSRDLEQVLSSVERRAVAGKKIGAGKYRQLRVSGANHFFQGHEPELVRHVIEWLESRNDS